MAPLERIEASAYTIPTDGHEADGTMAWDHTTVVVVEVCAGGETGLGYTYTDGCIVGLITGMLAKAVEHRDAMDPPAAWRAMQRAVRNIGREGLAATAIAAVDTAIWDLKAKLLQVPLALLFGRMREAVPIYGSGGFTSYSDERMADQLSGWVQRDGCRWVKMKIGSEPERDPARVRAAKRAIGEATLFVDANGAYAAKQALEFAAEYADCGVAWFEEPVSSDDLDRLRLVRHHAPPGMEIAAGEYGYTADYLHRMLDADAVDVLQADVTRCGGFTGWFQVAGLCEPHHVDLSGHCAPALHLHAACAVPRLRHLEWFHAHVRIEQMLFDGAPSPRGGMIRPDLSRPGIGLALKRQDAARYRTC
jgi:L-alanine-DL-glutamate epimerase-like enolase superfamily enzyme